MNDLLSHQKLSLVDMDPSAFLMVSLLRTKKGMLFALLICLPLGSGDTLCFFKDWGSSSGRTMDSGSINRGSNPCPPAMHFMVEYIWRATSLSHGLQSLNTCQHRLLFRFLPYEKVQLFLRCQLLLPKANLLI
jgi:hypothetical protein